MGCIVFRREGGREGGDGKKYGVGLEALKYCL